MAIGVENITLDESRDTLVNVNALGECVPSARFMGGRERDLLKLSNPVTDQAMQELLNCTESMPMLMPSVVPNTGPFPKAEQQWIGFGEAPHSTTQGTIQASAVTLYLALMTHECLLLIGADGPIFIEGPMAQDKQYAQMLAAVSDRPVSLSSSITGTSAGAAMLISPPEKKPDYTRVTVDPSKREQLCHYATLWKLALKKHLN